MRDPSFDDARLGLELYDLRRERELRKARALVGKLSTAGWEEIEAVMQHGHKRNAHWRQATSYWEMCASFVNRGIFHPLVFQDTCGEALFTYVALLPWLPRIRQANPRFLMQVETAIQQHANLRERVEQMTPMMASWRAAAEAERASGGAPAAKGKKKRRKG
ncbi:MAG: hypothetical protein ACKOSS_01810 [Planctomycetia bacterium]